jgi:hypothetical protein
LWVNFPDKARREVAPDGYRFDLMVDTDNHDIESFDVEERFVASTDDVKLIVEAITLRFFAEYIANGGEACPWPDCESSDIESRHVNNDNDGMDREMVCNECGREWTEQFRMTNIGITEGERQFGEPQNSTPPELNLDQCIELINERDDTMLVFDSKTATFEVLKGGQQIAEGVTIDQVFEQGRAIRAERGFVRLPAIVTMLIVMIVCFASLAYAQTATPPKACDTVEDCKQKNGTVALVFYCGATTKAGTPCKHRVKVKGAHCYQHGGAK